MNTSKTKHKKTQETRQKAISEILKRIDKSEEMGKLFNSMKPKIRKATQDNLKELSIYAADYLIQLQKENPPTTDIENMKLIRKAVNKGWDYYEEQKKSRSNT